MLIKKVRKLINHKIRSQKFRNETSTYIQRMVLRKTRLVEKSTSVTKERSRVALCSL